MYTHLSSDDIKSEINTIFNYNSMFCGHITFSCDMIKRNYFRVVLSFQKEPNDLDSILCVFKNKGYELNYATSR